MVSLSLESALRCRMAAALAKLLLAVHALTAVTARAEPASRPNVLLIAVDDLRPQFGRSFRNEEVLTPHMDSFFLDGGGSAFQRSYVQIAVCGPSRSSFLTSRRPDSTQVGVGAGTDHWCWCRRSKCNATGPATAPATGQAGLFMTLPLYFRQAGYVTAGNGKIFHPDACAPLHGRAGFTHANGDDPRAWSDPAPYVAEANFTQEQWGSIPAPKDPRWDVGGRPTMGLSWMVSNLTDEELTDGILATGALKQMASFKARGIGVRGGTKGSNNSSSTKPFFHAVGLHKPHLPHIAPKKYFDLYPADLSRISLPPNPRVPAGFKEENWHADGNGELESYNFNAGPEFKKEGFAFDHPISADFARQQRRAYFAATSYVDSQIGRILDGLKKHGFEDNTIVLVWSDHGWHLGDTNSWGKMTNFESATRNTLLWRVPGQNEASKGLNDRVVESVDIFPTLADLAGLAPLPACQGLDQPPSVLCTQGTSYASEFGVGGMGVRGGPTPVVTTAKKYAFSQWPFPRWGNETHFRMGYTVRSADGFRYSEYVSYDTRTFRGAWPPTPVGDDIELYDYNVDRWETTNFATNASYSKVVAELSSQLRVQYADHRSSNTIAGAVSHAST